MTKIIMTLRHSTADHGCNDYTIYEIVAVPSRASVRVRNQIQDLHMKEKRLAWKSILQGRDSTREVHTLFSVFCHKVSM